MQSGMGLLASDARSLLKSLEYLTPWFSSNRRKQPVTNLNLSFHPSGEYTTVTAKLKCPFSPEAAHGGGSRGDLY
jgi:hypothetical protein